MAPPTPLHLIANPIPEVDATSRATEDARLQGLYEGLRERLLDISNHNPMLNTRIAPDRRSRRLLQIVGVALEDVYTALTADAPTPLDLVPLPEPGDIPADEHTEAFRAAFEHARLTDAMYLDALAALQSGGGDTDAAVSEADEALRLRTRVGLGLPDRPMRHEIDRAEHARGLGIEPEPDLPLSSAAPTDLAPQLHLLRFPDELDDVVDRIADQARLATEETGLSPLFLAFGFLERPHADQPGKVFRAPLLLMPVKLVRRKIEGRALIAVTSEAGMEPNLSLMRLMDRDHRRTLPDIDLTRDDDEDAVGPIAAYFDGVAKAIDGLKGWRIRPWLVLGTFAFGRHQLHHDLNAANWPDSPTAHPLVRAILAGTDRPGDPVDADAMPDHDIDATDAAGELPRIIADADASQHSALIDVARGASIVIEGPPGTGKSQTIANLIAHAIGEGKKVLFLSEKQAALEVVRRRLVEAGLGPFCLELHSDGAVPRTVVAALKARVDLGWGRPRTPERGPDPVAVEARQSIGRYLADLHTAESDGETPFRLMWQAIRGANVDPAAFSALAHVTRSIDALADPERQEALRDAVQVYVAGMGEFEARHGAIGASPWCRTGLKDIPNYDFLRLRAALSEWRAPMLEAASIARAAVDFGVVTLADLERLTAIEADLGFARGAEFMAAFDGADINLAAAAAVLAQRVKIAEVEARMAETPELAASPRRATAEAAELVASRFGEALAPRVPLDLARAIRARLGEAQELVAALEGLMPALTLLGLARDRPADGFAEIALVCRALAAMTATRRADLMAHRQIAPGILAEAMRRQHDLTDALADWQRHFPGLDALRLPRVEDLRAAVAWLRRGSVARTLGALSAEARAARALVQTLTGGALELPDPVLFEQLADFVAYCETYSQDAGLRRHFGRDWHGLATPFDAISAAIALRKAFAQALGQASGGTHVVERLFEVGEEEIAGMIRLADAAERFLSLAQATRARLSGLSLGSAIPQLEADIRSAGLLGDLTANADLMALDYPLGVIADYHALRETLADLSRDLARLPEADSVARLLLGGDPVVAADAVAWIAEVRACPLPDEAKAGLIGARAPEIRGRLAEIAMAARATLARLEAIRAETEAEFGWFNLDAGDPGALLAQLDALIAYHSQLGDFLLLRRLKMDLAKDGLGAFLDTVERQQVPTGEVLQLFATLAARVRAERLRRTSSLGGTSGLELDVRRKMFAERDRQRILVDRAELRARLTQLPALRPIPGNNIGPKSAWTEMALVNSECAKSGRHLPVRALLARAGRSIQALMPCMMVSPLSLAKFATPGKLAFDLVVIDEASQMRPKDALGGLLRARQLVVVGDPKQLPPTDFFHRSEPEAPSDALGDENLAGESILDLAARSFAHVRRLSWHYRSHCESLIAFSNREFYRDSLITFPANRGGAFAIDLIRVDGAYRNRRNPDEAVRVAEEAARFMRHFAEAAECPTLGIATLNMEQRDLIREEVRRISVGDALIEAYLARVGQAGEPMFVKNLENLQGDERDYVMISLGIGRAPGASVVAQTFGPIGGRHGARRLNVLFTRARQGIGLFTSLRSDEVRPGDTSPLGAHVLKRYLAYVEERGRLQANSERDEPDSDFEAEVADRLRAAGFDVRLQVGVSQYRIDLAVMHPDRPGRYLAGIECDGARYHGSTSARDRDRLREEILAGLGWKLVRVWSTDWFADPDGETHRLVRWLDLQRVAGDRIGARYHFGFAEERAGEMVGIVSAQEVSEGAHAVNHPVEIETPLADVMIQPVEVMSSGGIESIQSVGGKSLAAEAVSHDVETLIPGADASIQVTVDVTNQDAPAQLTMRFREAGEGTDFIEEVPSVVVRSELGAASVARDEVTDGQAPTSGFEEDGSAYELEPVHTTALTGGDGPDLKSALIHLRETEIAVAVPGHDRHRSILRPSMIEVLINEHVAEPTEWEQKVPRYLRLGTDPAELRFLDRICALVARHG